MIKSKCIVPFVLLLIFSSTQVGFAGCDIFQDFQSNQMLSGTGQEQTATLTLADLGIQDPVVLRGPFQEISVFFTLPPDWDVTSPVQFEFQVESEFQSLMEAFTSDEISERPANAEGFLRFDLNGISVGEVVLDQSGELPVSFTTAPGAIKQNSTENELTISWDSGIACQYSISTVLTINPSSRIEIPYKYKEVERKLSKFPKPFYSRSDINPYPVALVLPENPERDDLSAMLAVSAGLGKLTNGGISYEIFLMNEINLADHGDYHLIFIGKMDALNNFFEKRMEGIVFEPSKISDNPDSGFLSIQTSPWNPGRAVMIVTGDDGESLLKASAVVAAEDFLPFSDGNQAVILQLSDSSSQIQFQIDHEFGELVNEEELHVEKLGETTVEIPFYLPGDTQITPESFIELYFRHSQLINYLQSSLNVSINEKMIGTIRFSDQSAENGLARIILPPDIIRPLKNTLKITFTIYPKDICADERSGNYWISIFKDSYLHLPPMLDVPTELINYYLNDLPNAFLHDNSLSQLVFVANQGDLQSWKYASDTVFNLGKFLDSSIMRPSAQFAASFEEKPEKDYILIGRTNDIPFSSGVNESLPIPMKEDGFIDEILMDGIQFRINSNKHFGILEIARMMDSHSLVLSILGNSEKGLDAAFDSAQNRIFMQEGTSANVEIIDEEGISHPIFIEKKLPANGEQKPQLGWFESILNLNAGNFPIYLLAAAVLITFIFIIWTVRTSSKTSKK